MCPEVGSQTAKPIQKHLCGFMLDVLTVSSAFRNLSVPSRMFFSHCQLPELFHVQTRQLLFLAERRSPVSRGANMAGTTVSQEGTKKPEAPKMTPLRHVPEDPLVIARVERRVWWKQAEWRLRESGSGRADGLYVCACVHCSHRACCELSQSSQTSSHQSIKHHLHAPNCCQGAKRQLLITNYKLSTAIQANYELGEAVPFNAGQLPNPNFPNFSEFPKKEPSQNLQPRCIRFTCDVQ